MAGVIAVVNSGTWCEILYFVAIVLWKAAVPQLT
jgi:hypothetical protein